MNDFILSRLKNSVGKRLKFKVSCIVGANYDKYFLNQSWHRDTRYLIPVIISALAFLTSLGNVLYTISNNRKIEKLQEQVYKLKTDKYQEVKKVE